MKGAEIVKKIWTHSPEEIFRKVKRRLKGVTSYDYSLEAILRDKKHMNTSYLIDRWERYWRVIESRGGQSLKKHFQFEGKNVFELGCGPLLGWGPMAIFLGAASYTYHDPELDSEIATDPLIMKNYFYPLYHELVSNFGERMSFSEFHEKVFSVSRPVSFDEAEPLDLILSNSVLEHIPIHELNSLFDKIYRNCRPEGHFLHSVDFGSHGIGGSGFGTLYSGEAGREVGFINSLRKPDIEKVILQAGFTIQNMTVYHTEPIHRKRHHPSWVKYSDEDLTSRVVFFVGRKKDG